jgi:hypothetical protein
MQKLDADKSTRTPDLVLCLALASLAWSSAIIQLVRIVGHRIVLLHPTFKATAASKELFAAALPISPASTCKVESILCLSAHAFACLSPSWLETKLVTKLHFMRQDTPHSQLQFDND